MKPNDEATALRLLYEAMWELQIDLMSVSLEEIKADPHLQKRQKLKSKINKFLNKMKREQKK